jgi:hypothetical protein
MCNVIQYCMAMVSLSLWDCNGFSAYRHFETRGDASHHHRVLVIIHCVILYCPSIQNDRTGHRAPTTGELRITMVCTVA